MLLSQIYWQGAVSVEDSVVWDACVPSGLSCHIMPALLTFHFQDPSRVITSSLDLSLRVYVWKKENKFPVLKSCYHLLGGSHRWAR